MVPRRPRQPPQSPVGDQPGPVAAPGPAVGRGRWELFGGGATPIAQRVAAAQGVDLGAVTGTARGGRITKDDVLAAADGAAEAIAALPAGAERIKGGAAALARYMEESR